MTKIRLSCSHRTAAKAEAEPDWRIFISDRCYDPPESNDCLIIKSKFISEYHLQTHCKYVHFFRLLRYGLFPLQKNASRNHCQVHRFIHRHTNLHAQPIERKRLLSNRAISLCKTAVLLLLSISRSNAWADCFLALRIHDTDKAWQYGRRISMIFQEAGYRRKWLILLESKMMK